MRLGLLTDCFLGWSLPQVTEWAARHGYGALEVAAWPTTADDHATHIDVTDLDATTVMRIRRLLDDAQLRVCALSYYDNLLDPDRGAAARDHLVAVCEAAGRLDVGVVGMFVGRDPRRTVQEDLRAAERLLPGLVEQADRRGVTLAVENCPMTVWHPDGQPGNLAYSPELWHWLADLGVGLVFDPSHLPPLGIDPVAVADDLPRLMLVQAKDVEVFPRARNRTGWMGPLRGGDGWWRYRTPGDGDVDWSSLLGVLGDAGYDGTVAVEQEDSVLGRSPDQAAAGLERARKALTPLL